MKYGIVLKFAVDEPREGSELGAHADALELQKKLAAAWGGGEFVPLGREVVALPGETQVEWWGDMVRGARDA